jgi:hypothetical protein
MKQRDSVEFELSLYENYKYEKMVRSTLKSKILVAYTEYYNTSRQLDNAKIALEYYKYMDSVQANLYKNGKITKNAADISAIEQRAAKNAVNTLQRTMGITKKNTAFLLNCYDETQYTIVIEKPEMATEFKTSPGLVKPENMKTEDFIIKLFTKNNIDLLRAKNVIRLEEEYYNRCMTVWEEDSEEALGQQIVIKQSELDYEQKKAEFTLNIVNKYAEYENLRDTYLYAVEKSKVFEESGRINKVLFDEGKVSEQEYRQNVIRYSEEIFSAEKDYLNVIIAVNNLKMIEKGIM